MRFLLLLLIMAIPALGTPSGGKYLKTDQTQLERDYRWPDDLRPILPSLQLQTPWETTAPGTRRKCFFNDRLTMVLLEVTGQNETPLTTHYHVHDQITYVLEGRALVQLGDTVKEVEAGAVYIAPSNVHHGLAPRSDRLVIVECFTPTREDFRDTPPGRTHNLNEVKSFVYHWFSLFDRRAPVEEFLPHLAPRELRIAFPEETLRSPADFRRWYAQAPPGTHDIEQLQVQPDGEGWQVELTVRWQGLRLHQSWKLASDLTIQSYEANKDTKE